jgi:predicted nuclease of predicted toxin-antitoxin system
LKEISFLADESCDFLIVRKLRSADYDVLSVAESFPSASDQQVLKNAIKEGRILLTEDKDFGEWVFAHGEKIEGVILIRFPGNARTRLGEEIILLVEDHGIELKKCFAVLEPGRARLRKI